MTSQEIMVNLQVGPGGSSMRHDGYVLCSESLLVLLITPFPTLEAFVITLLYVEYVVRPRDMVRSIKLSCVMLF
jgi:hypothetical protein